MPNVFSSCCEEFCKNARMVYEPHMEASFPVFQGYCYLSPNGKKKMMLCLACGQSMRAEKGLKQLLPGAPFFCVSGSEQKPLPRRPFKVISIAKVLPTYPAELCYCPRCNDLETWVHLDWPHIQVQLHVSTSSSEAPSHPANIDSFILIALSFDSSVQCLE